MKRLLLLALLVGCGGGDGNPTAPDPDAALGSFQNPAAIGQTVTSNSASSVWGVGQLDFTLLEVVHGEPAWQMAEGWRSYNTPPDPGKEIVLARFRVSALTVSAAPIEVNNARFSLVQEGVDLDVFTILLGVDPSINAEFFAPGATHEGWVDFEGVAGAADGLAVFNQGGQGETWFRLW